MAKQHAGAGMSDLRVLVACEFSGTVREAFAARGFDAWSCDILPTEIPGQHIVNDVRNVLDWNWDLLIAHPPCTHLAVSGARWFAEKQYEQREALDFVRLLMNADIPRIAIENPVSIISTAIREANQYVDQWWFGHGETKKTGLWLKNLPLLKPTCIVEGREARVHHEPPSATRWMERSRTNPGLAEAMADQWGKAITEYPIQLEMFAEVA